MKTIQGIRESFWLSHHQYSNQFRMKKRQNDYCADIRMAFSDYVDYLAKSGEITEKLANRATL